jgi:hypothetical protein
MERDIKRLSVYCADSKYNRYLGDDNSEIYKSWISAFRGGNLYYLIRCGISRREDWEPEEEDPFHCFKRDHDNTGVKYNLAYHQWNTFRGWLTNHPAARENFNQFKVSVIN